MDLPDIKELQRAARKMISQSTNPSLLTPRKVRVRLEGQFSLDENALDVTPYKQCIKKAAVGAVPDKLIFDANASEEELSADEVDYGSGSEDTEEKPITKPSGKRKADVTTNITAGRTGRKDRGKTKYKSASVVNSSGSEDESMSAVASSSKAVPQPSRDSKKAQKAPEHKPKTKACDKGFKSAVSLCIHLQLYIWFLMANQPVVHSSGDEAQTFTLSPKSKRPSKNASKAEQSSFNLQVKKHSDQSDIEPMRPNQEEKSDSERSLIIDEMPKKRKKQEKGSKLPQKELKEKKSKKAAASSSKDEEAVMKFKAIVSACGVRKAWKKEFEGLDKPSQQVKRLREILAGLGMTGRLSLEKAKAIRAKRELAQELADVKEFEEASRNRGKKRKPSAGLSAESSSESASEAEEAPSKKRRTARASIMAFLGDESE
ncbi:hypothetical protein BJ138DRAFT_345799 [Hygrophoropsis aurantiaca]|uniref:Uncharacterized protein n=1 Tax=Hygrophoropsis aurantiaca TaxID=72124 RepID=A0ACB8AM14_9AGAM|nr:hypothetical protein BJ138DRAFT_345799 [Hygrophoropsis aurantiaca]